MITEQYIKSKLDGQFFIVGVMPGPEARMVIRAMSVPVDYIPNHQPAWDYAVELSDEPHHNAVSFTPEQDETIVRMRQAGARWADVCKSIRRCINLTRDRYKVLCFERGIEPVRRIAKGKGPEKFSDAEKDQMVAMRVAGMSYPRIAEQFGTSKWTVADAIAKRRQKMRLAA